MNYIIDLYLLIKKYFKRVDDCIQYTDDGKKLYTASQVIDKTHNAVLEPVLYVNACGEWR